MSSESSKSGSIFVQYICCLSNLSCTASDSRSPSDLPSEAVLIICTSCLVYRCISFYVLVYPCISLILCVYIYLIICMSCFVYPSKSSHILVYPPVYLCFTDYVFQKFVFARTVSTDCFVWVQNNQPSKKIFLHCCMSFEYLSGCRPNRCKQNWKDFLPSSPEGIHWPLQATSMSADCERSTLSFQITINIYQPIHNSFAVKTNLMSLSIMVHHCLVSIAYSIAFLCQRLFSPNRKSSRQGKTASLGKVRNIVGGCTWAFPQHPWWLQRPSIGGDWIDTRRSLAWFVMLGTIHWCCLDVGRSKKRSQNQEDLDIVWLTHTQCPWRIPQITFPTIVCKHNCWWCI